LKRGKLVTAVVWKVPPEAGRATPHAKKTAIAKGG
jgi:hypothetical protein